MGRWVKDAAIAVIAAVIGAAFTPVVQTLYNKVNAESPVEATIKALEVSNPMNAWLKNREENGDLEKEISQFLGKNGYDMLRFADRLNIISLKIHNRSSIRTKSIDIDVGDGFILSASGGNLMRKADSSWELKPVNPGDFVDIPIVTRHYLFDEGDIRIISNERKIPIQVAIFDERYLPFPFGSGPIPFFYLFVPFIPIGLLYLMGLWRKLPYNSVEQKVRRANNFEIEEKIEFIDVVRRKYPEKMPIVLPDGWKFENDILPDR